MPKIGVLSHPKVNVSFLSPLFAQSTRTFPPLDKTPKRISLERGRLSSRSTARASSRAPILGLYPSWANHFLASRVLGGQYSWHLSYFPAQRETFYNLKYIVIVETIKVDDSIETIAKLGGKKIFDCSILLISGIFC